MFQGSLNNTQIMMIKNLFLTLLQKECYTVDPWTIQGLGALIPLVVEKSCLTWLPQDLTTNSLLSTRSLTDNIKNSWYTYFVCYMYYIPYYYNKVT